MSAFSNLRRRAHASVVFGIFVLVLALFASPALAGPPTHLPLDDPISGFALNKACGTAVDSEGDIYVSSAGNSKVEVFDPSGSPLTSIPNSNQPCGLAVNSKGELFVSERATGKVVRYKPNAYPFSGTPSYGSAEPIDSSGNAEGIAIDRFDDRLYVAKGDRITVYQADGSPEPASNEIQRVRIIESTGGTYTLTFRGQTTTPLAFNASCEQIETALEALATIGPGNVAVAPEASGDVVRCIVTFAGALFQKTVPQLRGDGSELTGGTFGLSLNTLVQGFSGHIGEGGLTEATGVAAYTYKGSGANTDRYVYAADAATDEVKVFGGPEIKQIERSETIAGVDHDREPATPDQGFGFGPAGADLAIDPGNRNAEDKCTSIAEQACTAGHLLVYDASHNVVDELEANGEFLDQFTDEAFADAEPTAMAVDRSGGPSDGAIYVSAGPGPGAKLLTFGPLAAPSRALDKSLSHLLTKAAAVTTDSYGNVYVAAGPVIHVYGPTGKELTKIEDPEVVFPLTDLAVDSTCKVYVLETDSSPSGKVPYYTPTPSACPPVDGTQYVSHTPIATSAEFPSGSKVLRGIAVNTSDDPGSKDHVLVTTADFTREYDSAKNGSGFLRCFACDLSTLEGNKASIAVNGATGNVYFGAGGVSIVDPEGEEILARINGAGAPEGPLSSGPKVAVEQSNGHVLMFDGGLGAAREYDASGAFVAEFGQFAKNSNTPARIAIDNSCALHDPPLTEATTPTCEEFDPANGSVYVAFENTKEKKPDTFDLTAFEPLTYGDTPLAVTGIATKVGAGNATLNGTVNPRGFELTECKFEYVTEAAFEATGFNDLSSGGSKPCVPGLAEIGKGKSPVGVHADVGGLDPEGRYRFRLLAKNKYGESAGDAWLFGPPKITTKDALPILYDEATLRADVDPSGLGTEYHFEYGKGPGEYDQSTPVAKLAPGDGPVAVQAALTGLAEGATYHFRVVAENEAKAVEGSDLTLITLQRRAAKDCPNVEFRTGLSANLPDCRAYELVTPAETNGLTPRATSSGTAGTLFNNWLVDPRGSGAGESLAYFTDGTLPGFDGNGRLDGYRAQRDPGEHPAEGWTSELFAPSFEESGPGTLHLAKQQGVSSDQLYSFWKMEPEEIFAGTLPEGIYLRGPSGFEVLGQGSLGTDLDVTSHYVSAGGAHAIFSSEAHLEPKAAPAGTEAIYDRAAGDPTSQVVSLKPGNTSFAAGENATYVASTEDGSAILFKVGGVLYLRSESQTTEIATAPNTFAGISEDGERVFYAATSSDEAPATLFACDVETGPCAGTGAHAPTQIAPSSIFVNVSSDGSHAFFTSKEAFTGSEENEAGEAAEAGEHNLYAWDAQAETTSFIAQLVSQDFDPNAFDGFPPGDLNLMKLDAWTRAINPGTFIGRANSPTRSTPDGEVFVFQSNARLTSYDNEGGHGEIYRYDPAAASGERLLCVSCDPSGAPPSADADALLQDTSTGTGVNNQTLIANVTDEGREVFFQSPDRLLPEDANGVFDVYEWQAKDEVEGCKRDSGCLALISSGQGEKHSFLYGMSADGHDVFFSTPEKLVGADVPGGGSIYDARVNGGIPDPPTPIVCDGDACQGPGSTPPALPAPASTATGDGNVPGKGKPRCRNGKHRVKGRCVKKHHKRKHPRRRANHDRRAQR
jgi:hypothetical protein